MIFGSLGRFALGQFDEAPSNAILIATAGAYTLTGQATTFSDKLIVTAGAYTISGQAITLSDAMLAVAGAYAVTGVAITFKDSLAAVAGAYAITGQAATFADKMLVTAGSYAVTGQATVLNPIETVTAGSYAIAGNAITYKFSMVCAPGAYVITGTPVIFTQVINGAGGETRPGYRGKLELERRKIRVTDDEGRARKVDMLRRFKPPPAFTGPAPDWALGKAKAAPSIPTPGISSGDDERAFAPAPAMPAARLPQSLLALQDAKDENELVEFLTNTPDPLVEDIRQMLGVLAASGQLQALLENA